MLLLFPYPDTIRAISCPVSFRLVSSGTPRLRAQPREDTGLSLAEAVFGAPIALPNEFLKGDEITVDTNSKNFSKILGCSRFFLTQAQFEPSAAQ